MEQNRKKLDQRRPCITQTFEHNGINYILSAGLYEGSWDVGEVFLNMSMKQGDTLDNLARDAAVAVSIALQYGATVEELRTAMQRDKHGNPHSFIGKALDVITRDIDTSVEETLHDARAVLQQGPEKGMGES